MNLAAGLIMMIPAAFLCAAVRHAPRAAGRSDKSSLPDQFEKSVHPISQGTKFPMI